MEKVTETKWLDFILTGDTGKTKRYNVNTKGADNLGTIRWYPGWRRYVFCPNKETVYDAACLVCIADFCNQLMDERKSITL